jgi:hypothetical protein
MEAAGSSEIAVYAYKTTRCHNPKDLNLNDEIYMIYSWRLEREKLYVI